MKHTSRQIINYALSIFLLPPTSAVENKGELCVLIPSTEETVVETDRKESEYDSNDAHVYDPQIEGLTQNVKDWNINEIDDIHAQSYRQHQPQFNYDDPPKPMPCRTVPVEQSTVPVPELALFNNLGKCDTNVKMHSMVRLVIAGENNVVRLASISLRAGSHFRAGRACSQARPAWTRSSWPA